MQNNLQRDYKKLFGFDKPSQLILILFQILWVLWLASSGFPAVYLLCVFVFGVIALYVFCHVCATQTDAGSNFSKKQIQNYAVLFAIIAIALLALTHWMVWIFSALGCVPVVFYLKLKKEKSIWKSILYGLLIAWFVPLIFVAQKHMLPHLSWIVYAAVASWTITYNSFRQSVKDQKNSLISTALWQTITFVLLMITGIIYGQGLFYFIALLIILFVFISQLVKLQKERQASHRWIYLSHIWIAALVFFVTVINYHY